MPDNVNPHAQSEESARKPGDITTYSINEPGPDAPQPFKVPEDHTATTKATLEQAYPEGYVAPEPTEQASHKIKATELGATDDPDELEDELEQAKEEGDFKSSKPHRPSPPSKKGK